MTIEADDLLSADERPNEGDAGGMPPIGRRAHAVQRVQIGLIGLAAMVLLVGLANVIISNARQNQAEVVPEAASTVAPQSVTAPVSDPLADVGVLPDLPDIPVLDTSQGAGATSAAPGTGDAPPPSER